MPYLLLQTAENRKKNISNFLKDYISLSTKKNYIFKGVCNNVLLYFAQEYVIILKTDKFIPSRY